TAGSTRAATADDGDPVRLGERLADHLGTVDVVLVALVLDRLLLVVILALVARQQQALLDRPQRDLLEQRRVDGARFRDAAALLTARVRARLVGVGRALVDGDAALLREC